MLYIFWGLLNLFFVAGFFVVSFHAAKLLRAKYGRFITAVFILTFCSFVFASNNEGQANTPTHTLHFRGNQKSLSFQQAPGHWSIQDSMAKNYEMKDEAEVVVHKNPLFKIYMRVRYGTEVGSEKLAPLHSYVSLSGLTSGIEWKPASPSVFVDESGKNFTYHVSGVMEWKLLNFTLYSESKTFMGKVF